MFYKLRTVVPTQSQNVEEGDGHDQENGWEPTETDLAAWHEPQSTTQS